MFQSINNHPFIWGWVFFGVFNLLASMHYIKEHRYNSHDKIIEALVIFPICGIFIFIGGPIMTIGQFHDGHLEWPMTKEEVKWIWDHGIVFLPVLATLLVWLV